MGPADQPDYVNAVAQVHTALAAPQLLTELLAIERRQGRRRCAGQRNAPRTLDLDLLLYGQLAMRDDELTLPHPRMHLRAFVLRPLAELDPALSLPGLGLLAPWLARAADQAIERLAAA
jgi:2-amino-4-hydroxy-6-hydroxymethyldihydropteridine diphosphokinase